MGVSPGIEFFVLWLSLCIDQALGTLKLKLLVLKLRRLGIDLKMIKRISNIVSYAQKSVGHQVRQEMSWRS